eukprot:scaffold103958_cov23-Tisochrysis_lutea.AAC.2
MLATTLQKRGFKVRLFYNCGRKECFISNLVAEEVHGVRLIACSLCGKEVAGKEVNGSVDLILVPQNLVRVCMSLPKTGHHSAKRS